MTIVAPIISPSYPQLNNSRQVHPFFGHDFLPITIQSVHQIPAWDYSAIPIDCSYSP